MKRPEPVVTVEGFTPEWCLRAARQVLRLETFLPPDPHQPQSDVTPEVVPLDLEGAWLDESQRPALDCASRRPGSRGPGHRMLDVASDHMSERHP